MRRVVRESAGVRVWRINFLCHLEGNTMARQAGAEITAAPAGVFTLC